MKDNREQNLRRRNLATLLALTPALMVGAPLGFQLAYDKHRNEHSIAWRAGRGFTHYQVDDGEAAPLSKETPFLYLDGAFQRDRVLAEFLAAADALPSEIAVFVAARMREFEGRLA